MPIEPGSSENEQTFIGRCMSEETKDYPQDQAYAICKSKWDNKNMTKIKAMSSEQRVMYRIYGEMLKEQLLKGND